MLVLFLVIGSILLSYLYQDNKQKEISAREVQLMYQHDQTIAQFKGSIDKFAGLVSGMKSYVNMSPEIPNAEALQKFVNNQFSDLGIQVSYVISYIDSSHIFRQSFTRFDLDPVNLVGTSVRSIRSEKQLKRLDNLMTQDSLIVFPPLNLVEGWVGLPINFRVHRNDVTYGYIAPILRLKTILNDIYTKDLNNEFIYHFSTEEDFDFDREQTYNNTEVYSINSDPEYYKNYTHKDKKFIYTTKSYYGFKIKIGTAYREPLITQGNFFNLLLFWFATFAIMATLVAWQVNRLKMLSVRILKKNDILLNQRKEISTKNNQLQKLNETQTKFFSIIGHDIKQPLSAIEGLLGLLEYEEIRDPELAEIIKNLQKSTKNTTNLLNNLLRCALSQTGDLKFSPTQLNLNAVLEDVVGTLFFQAKEKSVRLLFQPKFEMHLTGDKDMLSTLFRNLISNAIKYTNPGGTVEINTRDRLNNIEITVIDNGIGMTSDKIANLFTLDNQPSRIGTTGEMGTGLGLILCNIFVDNHGGEIIVDSEPDIGTTFTVILPKVKTAP